VFPSEGGSFQKTDLFTANSAERRSTHVVVPQASIVRTGFNRIAAPGKPQGQIEDHFAVEGVEFTDHQKLCLPLDC
jgi:hypothetical protein